MKWLVKQRNVEGGFASTQDTVVGLYALAKLGEKLRANVYDLRIRVTTDIGEQKEISINSRNFMIVQKHEVKIFIILINFTFKFFKKKQLTLIYLLLHCSFTERQGP